MDHVRLHYVMLTKSFDFKNSQILLKDLTIARAKNNWVKLMKANNMNSFIEAKDYNNQLYDGKATMHNICTVWNNSILIPASFIATLPSVSQLAMF